MKLFENMIEYISNKTLCTNNQLFYYLNDQNTIYTKTLVMKLYYSFI